MYIETRLGIRATVGSNKINTILEKVPYFQAAKPVKNKPTINNMSLFKSTTELRDKKK